MNFYQKLHQFNAEISPETKSAIYNKCQENGWLKKDGYAWQDDPDLEDYPYSLILIKDIETLRKFFNHGNWALRSGVIYKDLVFIQQVDGGDEWWTLKEVNENGYLDFESNTFHGVAKHPKLFSRFINEMELATPKQCEQLDYDIFRQDIKKQIIGDIVPPDWEYLAQDEQQLILEMRHSKSVYESSLKPFVDKYKEAIASGEYDLDTAYSDLKDIVSIQRKAIGRSEYIQVNEVSKYLLDIMSKTEGVLNKAVQETLNTSGQSLYWNKIKKVDGGLQIFEAKRDDMIIAVFKTPDTGTYKIIIADDERYDIDSGMTDLSKALLSAEKQSFQMAKAKSEKLSPSLELETKDAINSCTKLNSDSKENNIILNDIHNGR